MLIGLITARCQEYFKSMRGSVRDVELFASKRTIDINDCSICLIWYYKSAAVILKTILEVIQILIIPHTTRDELFQAIRLVQFVVDKVTFKSPHYPFFCELGEHTYRQGIRFGSSHKSVRRIQCQSREAWKPTSLGEKILW